MSATPGIRGGGASGACTERIERAERSGPASRRTGRARKDSHSHGKGIFLATDRRDPACGLAKAPANAEPSPCFLVRNAERGDVPALAKIWRQMMAEHEALHPAFTLAEDAVARWGASVVEMVDRHDSFVYLAVQNGVPVGFCTGRVALNPTVYATHRVGLICELAVAPEARRRGVGAALVARARAFFATRALGEFQLSSALQNTRGRAFWRAMGGEELLVRFRFDLA